MARDTDRDWQNIAQSFPYHGVLTQEKYLNPDNEALREFFSTGDGDIAHHLSSLRRVFGTFEPRSALDFGCGVGRLLIPLAKECGSGVGVDIADGMLDLAAKHCQEAHVQAELMRTIPTDRRFDWVNTTIVLQHIPPNRGYKIIRDLWNCVASGGCFTFQITAYKDNRHFGELQRDLTVFRYDGESVLNYSIDVDDTTAMYMFDYDLSKVFSILALPDGTPVFMQKTDHGGCHGFYIYLRKT